MKVAGPSRIRSTGTCREGPRRIMQPSVRLVSLVPAHQVSSPGLRT